MPHTKSPKPTHITSTSSSLTPELRDRFDALLLTWPLQEVKGKVSASEMERAQQEAEQKSEPSRSVFAAPTDWKRDYEERWGKGDYPDRKKALYTIIKSYDRGGKANLEAVCQDLTEAREKFMALRWEVRGTAWTRDNNDRLKQVHDFIKSLRPGLRKAQRTLRELGYTELGNGNKPKLTAVVDDLLARIERSDREPDPDDSRRCSRLEDDLLLTLKFPGPQRRGKRGHPTASVITEVRTRLYRHGITRKNDRDDLLWSVGIPQP